MKPALDMGIFKISLYNYILIHHLERYKMV